MGKPQFFYADMTALTLGKIFRLLGFKFQLPPPVAQTGFPEGASVSIVNKLSLNCNYLKQDIVRLISESRVNVFAENKKGSR